jgi:hypothetical protein
MIEPPTVAWEWREFDPAKSYASGWAAAVGPSDLVVQGNAEGGHYVHIYDFRLPVRGDHPERKGRHYAQFTVRGSLETAQRKAVEAVTTNRWRFGEGLRQVPDRFSLIYGAIEAMEEAGRTRAEVAWVGSRDGRWATSWRKFVRMDAAYEYNGRAPKDIVIVFGPAAEYAWLERREYDGGQWWQYCTLPRLQLVHQELTDLSQIGPGF